MSDRESVRKNRRGASARRPASPPERRDERQPCTSPCDSILQCRVSRNSRRWFRRPSMPLTPSLDLSDGQHETPGQTNFGARPQFTRITVALWRALPKKSRGRRSPLDSPNRHACCTSLTPSGTHPGHEHRRENPRLAAIAGLVDLPACAFLDPRKMRTAKG